MSQNQVVETTLRVRYAETDAMGVVYHAHYLVWFEVGRGDYFRALGQDYGKWEERGYLLPVSEAYARYHGPARYSDLITVHTRLEEVRSRGLTLGYEVRSASTRQRLATGWTRHICTDRLGHTCRLPEELLKSLQEQ
jgi:acyl-CoA thioester hydrolase